MTKFGPANGKNTIHGRPAAGFQLLATFYSGAGACSMFRMFQGWLSMSHTGPNQGTLMVNPLLQLATTYFLLRPFFSPIKKDSSLVTGQFSPQFLDPEKVSQLLIKPWAAASARLMWTLQLSTPSTNSTQAPMIRALCTFQSVP